jgi:SAM dependent carboxyl methyltransferase
VSEPPTDRAVTHGMKGGGYYDAHSEFQRRIVEGGAVAIRSVVAGLDLATQRRSLTVVDYGAGTGATSVAAMGSVVDAVRERASDLAILAVHNDQLTNDFTQLFAAVAGDGGYLGRSGGPVYPAAAAGSFFDQVLPASTVDLGMCSNAVHWFRRQPSVDFRGMYFSAADPAARRALSAQAAEDWLAFLRARHAELVPGGSLLVQGISTTTDAAGVEHASAALLLDVMWEVATRLSDEGVLDRDTLDRYVFPVYCRSAQEASAPLGPEGALRGSFEEETADVEEVANPYWELFERDRDGAAYAEVYAAFVRAFAESALTTHLFGPGARQIEPAVLCDRFFDLLRESIAANPEASRYRAWILRLVLRRR